MNVIFSKRPRKPKLKKRRKLIRAAERALELSGLTEQFPGDTAVNVVLVSAAEIYELNKQFMGHDYVTDVIAFEMQDEESPFEICDDEPVTVGEIYVCLPVAEENAGKFGNSIGREVMLYIVHGMLHLSGEKDSSEAEKEQIREKERLVLDAIEQTTDLAAFF